MSEMTDDRATKAKQVLTDLGTTVAEIEAFLAGQGIRDVCQIHPHVDDLTEQEYDDMLCRPRDESCPVARYLEKVFGREEGIHVTRTRVRFGRGRTALRVPTPVPHQVYIQVSDVFYNTGFVVPSFIVEAIELARRPLKAKA